jgi:2-amino-4-hydroxy-6-hydroxymethyldihydropteridine diphosphokinase
MENVFLGIGSNVGDRIHFLTEAVRKLRATPSTRVVKISSVYETEPVGVKNQNDFLNAVVLVHTSAGVADFHSRIKVIEKEVGRVERIAGALAKSTLIFCYMGIASSTKRL